MFVVAALALDARATYGARVTADEPQYLLTSLSLAEDADLDIADELRDERFLDFHEVRLNPQTIELNAAGQRLSPHDPLLPLLLAPGMAVAGWVGAKLVLAAIGASTAMVTLWTAVRRFGVSPSVAALTVGGFFVTPPLTSYSTQVYPEMAAALAVMVAVGALTGRKTSAALTPTALAPTVLATISIVALPWLSVKYVPVAAVLAVALVGPPLLGDKHNNIARDLRRGILLCGALAAAGGIYLIVHQRIYGGWTVYAAGDHFVDGEFEVVGADPDYIGRSRRLVGLLIDREFGLIPWMPGFLLLPAALARLGRRRPSGWLLLVGLVMTGWAVATWVALTMHGWWWPGRQLVVVLPLAAVAIAMLIDDNRRLRPYAITAALVGMLSWLWLVIESSTDRRTLIVCFAETSGPWYRLASPLFPRHQSLIIDGWDLALTVGWTVAIVSSMIWGWRQAATGPDAQPGTRSNESRLAAVPPLASSPGSSS